VSMVFFSLSVLPFPFRIAVLIVVFDIFVFRHLYLICPFFWRSGGRADGISRGESIVINEVRALRGDIWEGFNDIRALRGDVREGFDRLCAEVARSALRGDVWEGFDEVRALRGDIREDFDRLCTEVAQSARGFKFYFEN
jgi:hypothetical protein